MRSDHRVMVPAAVLAGLAGAMLLAAGSVAARSEVEAPNDKSGRFTMQPTDGGVLRLDTATGALSMCKAVQTGWSCSLLPDDRTALADEIERLKAENSELKSAVKRLEDLAGLPGSSAPGGGNRPHGPAIQLPSEEDVDKAMSYVERMLKKFKDKLKDLEGMQGGRGQPL